MGFSEGEIGNFGGFMLILFRASDGNRILEMLSFYHWVLQNLQDYASLFSLQNYAPHLSYWKNAFHYLRHSL